MPFPDRSFDCVCSLEVLEHLPLPDFNATLRELARVASNYLIVSVPYREKIDQNVTTCPSCKTVFNVDLHLRAFDNDAFIKLFRDHGFTCSEYKNIVERRWPFGSEVYAKLRTFRANRKERREFRSPICPLCGYENTSFSCAVPQAPAERPENNLTRNLKNRLKSLLPTRRKPGYWIVGLFVRNT